MTRVLTTPIVWLMKTGQASPGVLPLSFTNRAAVQRRRAGRA